MCSGVFVMGVAGLRLTPVLVTLLLICNLACCNASRAGCAPQEEVTKALKRAEEVASEQLGPEEAVVLLGKLKEKEIVVDGQVCFFVEDFEQFGHIVAEFLRNHNHLSTSRRAKEEEEDWQPTFTGNNEDETVSASRCACVQCPSRHKPWCSSKAAACCPEFCYNIFQAISVGALTGMRGNGVDACCEDGAVKCRRLRARDKEERSPSSQNRGHAPPSSSDSDEVPDFNFGSGQKAPSSSPKRPKNKRKSEDEIFTVTNNLGQVSSDGAQQLTESVLGGLPIPSSIPATSVSPVGMETMPFSSSDVAHSMAASITPSANSAVLPPQDHDYTDGTLGFQMTSISPTTTPSIPTAGLESGSTMSDDEQVNGNEPFVQSPTPSAAGQSMAPSPFPNWDATHSPTPSGAAWLAVDSPEPSPPAPEPGPFVI